MYRASIFSILLLILSACATSKFEPLAEATPQPYVLGTGDELRISVYRLAELTGDYIVNDVGTISIPLLNTVVAAGKRIEDLENDIEQAIAAKDLVREPNVTAQIQKYRPFFIVGEVQRPGQYSYVPNMTVLTAVSIAGGHTFRANSDKVVITRTVGDLTTSGTAKPESLVLPGDTIKVYEGWF